jgi:hypothetical protein
VADQAIRAFAEKLVTAALSVLVALMAREAGGAITNRREVGCVDIGGSVKVSMSPGWPHPAKPTITPITIRRTPGRPVTVCSTPEDETQPTRCSDEFNPKSKVYVLGRVLFGVVNVL